MHLKLKADRLTFNIIAYMVTFIFSLACLLPFVVTLVGSLMTESERLRGLTLFPKQLTLDSYMLLLKEPQAMLQAYRVTIVLVVVGTVTGLLVCSMAAYVLQNKHFVLRGFFSMFFFFTTLFSGGMVSYYIWITKLNLRDNFLVLFLPGVVSVFNIIIIRTFFKSSVPYSLDESATIDGAGVFRVYWQFYLPLSKPVLATVGLFSALGYWNDWSTAMLFISNQQLFPLQYYLYRMLNSMEMAILIAKSTGKSMGDLPTEGFRLAMTIFTIGPIILLYPFVQKYFVQGVVIGSIKE